MLIAFLLMGMNSVLAHATAPLTLNDWKHQMQNTETPGFGCFTATYPDNWWARIACANDTLSFPMVGQNGPGYVSQLCSCQYPIGSATGQVTTESGFQSETDTTYGTNSFSIQLNSNTYPITFQGTNTNGWTQFVLQNRWYGGITQLIIEWWLLGGYSSSNPCPQGWDPEYPNCALDSAQASFPAQDPANLPSIQLSGSASSTQDKATYCLGSTCNSVTGGDTTFLSQGNNWKNTEWNVFGMANSSTANFNVGASLTITVSIGLPDPEDITCAQGDYTGESNNLNNASCNTPYAWEYQFTENLITHCPPSCTLTTA